MLPEFLGGWGKIRKQLGRMCYAVMCEYVGILGVLTKFLTWN